MVTGRQTAEKAFRAPMIAAGWQSRATGWFTRTVSPDHLGVLALGSASKHATPGTALVTVYVGIRQDVVESVVADLRGVKGGDYRERTAVTSIGYLMPEKRWRDWPIGVANADDVAAEVCDAVTTYALPWLLRMTTDTDGLLAGVKASPSFAQSTGLIRYTVLLAVTGQPRAASDFLNRQADVLASQSDAAAEVARRAIESLREWLPQSG